MISFTNPAWLWGFSALLVPIGIHLLSRKSGKIIYIGSIRHLRDSDTAKFSSIRLNEITLLAIRVLFMALVVLVLAGFSWNFGNSKARWVIVETGADQTDEGKAFIKEALAAGFEKRFLESGFPTEPSQSDAEADYATLAANLENLSVDTAVIISFNLASRFRGSRFALPSNVNWLSIDPGEVVFPVRASAIGNDTLKVRSAATSGAATEMQSKTFSRASNDHFFKLATTGDSVAIDTPKTLQMQIIFDREYEYDAKVLRASLLAIDEAIPEKFVLLNDTINKNADFLFWLSNRMPPSHHALICISTCHSDLPLVISKSTDSTFCQRSGNAQWTITKRLNEETALSGQLSLGLVRVVQTQMKNIRIKRDHRTLSNESMWGNSIERTRVAGDDRLATGFLIASLLMVLLIERLIAFRKNQ